jgi:Delta7-sterol 5-desaturase
MVANLAIAALLTSAIVALRYLALSGVFAAITARRHRTVLADPARAARRRRQVRREIGWSLLAAVIYGAPAGIVGWLYSERGHTLLYADAAAYPLWWLPASIAVYLLAHDAWFYWTHRLMHTVPRLFRAAHAVHHESRPPTAWAAMAFHPWEALSAAWLYPVLVFIVPIHIGALAVVATIASLFAVTNHLGWEIYPRSWLAGWFGRHIITASHHHLHHGNYQSNYGLYFRFWDRARRTDRGLTDSFG